jgi:hypothetical protein
VEGQFRDLDTDWRVLLKWILNRSGARVLSGFIRLMVVSSEGLL